MSLQRYAPSIVGSQTPRILHLPSSEPSLGNAGKAVASLAALAGLDLDPWQSDFIANATQYRKDAFYNPILDKVQYKWAAREVGLMISRQNGKGSVLEARELAGLFLFGERLIIHSAHQFDTSKEAFERILMLIESTREFDREVSRVSRSHGEEGIELKSGQRLRFRTRTKGGGRGFTCDCLVLDEAMILGVDQVRAILPVVSARPNPQIWYTGSAGDKDSTQFGRVRSRGIRGTDPRLLYAEFSADIHNLFCAPDCDEHMDIADPATWAYANASLNIASDHGITMDALSGDFESMDPDSFAAEHLGVGTWPVDGEGWLVISKEAWQRRHEETSEIDRTKGLAIGVDTSPDGIISSIGAAGYSIIKGPDGQEQVHIELTGDATQDVWDWRPGTQWVVPRVKEIWRNQRPSCVVIDPASPAGQFIYELEQAGINVVTPTTREFAQACGEFKSAVVPRRGEVATLVHIDQRPVNSAVAVADIRNLQDLWAWSKPNSSSDISPLVALTLASWGLRKHGKKAANLWVRRR